MELEFKMTQLNVPDALEILGIFESNDTANPDLPSIVVSSQSDTFTNNVIIGETFIDLLLEQLLEL